MRPPDFGLTTVAAQKNNNFTSRCVFRNDLLILSYDVVDAHHRGRQVGWGFTVRR